MIIESIFTFIAASAVISIAPGPDNSFVLTQSALHGPKVGIMITLGLCTGLIVHTAAVALGVAAFFQTSTLAFTILTYVGAVYLLYLAWLSFICPISTLNPSDTGQSYKTLYLRGVIMNITNPKVSIFFLAFLPQFTDPQSGSLVIQFVILGFLFILVAFSIFCCIAILSGSLTHWFIKSPKNQVFLNRIAGVVFAGLALKLILLSATA